MDAEIREEVLRWERSLDKLYLDGRCVVRGRDVGVDELMEIIRKQNTVDERILYNRAKRRFDSLPAGKKKKYLK